MLDDEEVSFRDSEIDDGTACAEAGIVHGVPGAQEVWAELSNIRAHRILQAGDADAALAAWDAIIAASPTYLAAYVGRAEVLATRGDHHAAMVELDRYVERSPTDANGYLYRAKRYQAQGDGERALANFRRAAQLDRNLTDAHLGMAQALTAKGDSRGAARAYAKAAEEELADAESYDMRGFMYFVSGQEELALADYEASFALDPNNVDTLAWRGLLRSRLDRVEESIADFTRLIAMRPSEARGYWRRGEALVRVGRHAEALEDLDRAIALGEDERGAAHLARAMALEELGDKDGALASYDVAIERDETSVTGRLRRLRLNSEREDWAKCQIDADALVASAPDSPSMLLAHARLCVRNDRRADAKAAYDRLIALDPRCADAYYERADLRGKKGDTLASRADRAKAFELAPDNAEFRAAHGRDRAKGATTDEERAAGVELILGSIELDPDNPEAWANAAYRMREVGQPSKGVELVTRALELHPDHIDYLFERSTCLEACARDDPQGREAALRRALADAERALELVREGDEDIELELHHKRADLREGLGDLAGAMADYTWLIEEAPELLDSWAERARLRKHTGDMAGALADAAQVKQIEDETIAQLKDAHPRWPTSSGSTSTRSEPHRFFFSHRRTSFTRPSRSASAAL